MQWCSQVVCDQAATDQKGDRPIGRDLSYPTHALKPSTTPLYTKPTIRTQESVSQPFPQDRGAAPLEPQMVPVATPAVNRDRSPLQLLTLKG